MIKFITVCSPGNQSMEIRLSYLIEHVENTQVITCSVNEKQSPLWLQLRKFTLVSLKEAAGFVPIFIEANNSKNMATSLFIDKVYLEIMHFEKLKILSSAIA